MSAERFLRSAFADLKAEFDLSDAEAIACWLEFIADQARILADEFKVGNQGELVR